MNKELFDKLPSISINPESSTRKDIAEMASEIMEMRKEINLAIGYLNVCHLANHSGSQIKVDQALNVLHLSLNIKEGCKHKWHKIANGPPWGGYIEECLICHVVKGID